MIDSFLVQWHITNKCNLRCTHCYYDEHYVETSFEQLIKIYKQILDFKKYWNANLHINITGGEPFISPHLFKLLDLFEKDGITFAILTNGTLINSTIIKSLSLYKNLCFVQVSIDGDENTHDSIRGNGSYQKALSGLRLLRKAGIKTSVSFTISKINMHCLKDVITMCRKEHITWFWSDRLIPFGNAEIEQCVSNDEFKQFINILNYESTFNRKRRTVIKNGRALQGNCCYHCEAGDSFFTIDENGILLPCRRMPIEIGSLLENNLIDLYLDNVIMQDLRKHKIPDECSDCNKKYECRGGLKCLSYAVNKDYNSKDPNCMY